MKISLDFEVVVGLDVYPEPVVDTEGPGQAQGGVGVGHRLLCVRLFDLGAAQEEQSDD